MKPAPFNSNGRLGTPDEVRRSALTGQRKGNISRTVNRPGNRADDLLRKFD